MPRTSLATVGALEIIRKFSGYSKAFEITI